MGSVPTAEAIPILDWDTPLDSLKGLGVNGLNFKCLEEVELLCIPYNQYAGLKMLPSKKG